MRSAFVAQVVVAQALALSLFAAPALAQSPDEETPPVATPVPDATATPEPAPTPEGTPAAATPTPTPATAATATAPDPDPEPPPEPRRRRYESPKWFSAQLGGGALQLEGDIASEVYGDGYEPTLHGRMGVLLFSILDLGISADFTQITARRLGADDGAESAEISRLTLVPMSAQALVRLDFFPNQPVVPYGGAGWAYLVWSERNPIEDDQVDGDKQGVTFVGGVQILLDWVEPARAQDLDSWWGVNDTYLLLEVSQTTYGDSDDEKGLDLGHLQGRAAFLFEF